MDWLHRYRPTAILLWCGLVLSLLTVTVACTSCGGLVSIKAQDVASATVEVTKHDFEMSKFPIDLTDPAKQAELVGLMNGLQKLQDSRSHGGTIVVALDVTLVDGGKYAVIWWTGDYLELAFWDAAGNEVRPRSDVESSEMRAFFAPYYEQYYWH
jgi:hypothetical protein